MYYIYVLKSENFRKSYVGSTDNVEKRLIQHNRGKSNFTKKYKPWVVLYSEAFDTRNEALRREKYLKSKTGRKFLKSVVFK